MHSAENIFECIRPDSNVFGQIRMHSARIECIRLAEYALFVQCGQIRSSESGLLVNWLFGRKNLDDVASTHVLQILLQITMHLPRQRVICIIFECIWPRIECIRPDWLNTLFFSRPNTLFREALGPCPEYFMSFFLHGIMPWSRAPLSYKTLPPKRTSSTKRAVPTGPGRKHRAPRKRP